MKVYRLIILGVLLGAIQACAHQQLGGLAIDDTFSDPKVVSLVHAAVRGDSAAVEELAKAGADINATGINGATPLIWALNARNHSGTEALLKAGANPNLVPTKLDLSAMYFVSMGDDPVLLDLLLKHGGNPNHPERGRIFDRPLSQAASEGRLENLSLLLAAGADINAHDQFEQSAATAALALANFEAVAFLLNHGYTYDLSYLEKRVTSRQVPPTSEAQRWKERVLEMLKARASTSAP